MKRVICVLCSLAIMLVCIGGCGAVAGNPFTAENAIKGQVGDLYYVVPGNAVLEESTDEKNSYSVPITNSNEEYILDIVYLYADEEAYKAAIQLLEFTRELIAAEIEENAGNGASYEEEDITEFLGKSVNYGIKTTYIKNGLVEAGITVAIADKFYSVRYTVKSAFYDQAVWDNFYAQLKFV